MKYAVIIFVAIFCCPILSAQDFTIDFEQVPNETNRERMLINTQYQDMYGVRFVLENGDDPHLAEVGWPAVAFGGDYGDDTPAPGQNIGSFFLTDDGVLGGLNAPPLIIHSDFPLMKISCVILDIDFDEQYLIQSMDADGNILKTIQIRDRDPNTGDALATYWEIEADNCEAFYSVRIAGSRNETGAFGLGADNISFTRMEEFNLDQVFVNEFDIDCNENSGMIFIVNESGEELTYSIDGINFQSENIFENLAVGNYVLFVQNKLECPKSIPFQIDGNEPMVLSSIATATECGLNNGSIVVTVLNGMEPIQYSIDDVMFQSVNVFNDLAPGDYTVTVVDAAGCEQSQTVTVHASESLMIQSAISPQCGEEYGSIAINVLNGIAPFHYFINGTIIETEVALFDLPAGDYIIRVLDANGCEGLQHVSVVSNELPTIETSIAQATTCGQDDGVIEINAFGGTGELEYSINGEPRQREEVYTNLPAGTYVVEVTDEVGCVARDSIQIDSSVAVDILHVEVDLPDCDESNGMIKVEAIGGTGQINAFVNQQIVAPDFVAYHIGAGFYEISVTDILGCQQDTSFFLAQKRCPFYIPNAFSPNDDGINDRFIIYPHPQFAGRFNNLKIFDRWGELIFEARAFDPSIWSWDGTRSGKPAAVGAYVFVLEVWHADDEIEIIKGDLSLVK